MSSFYDLASLVVVPSGYKSGKIYAQKPLSTDGELTFSRASSATRVGPDWLIQRVRTNLVLQSETFSTTWAVNGIEVTPNTAANPLTGTTTADTITANAANNFHLIGQSITYAAGEATVSVYVKANGYTWFVIDPSITNAFGYYNITTGVVGTKGSACTTSITNVGGGWYRCSVTFTATAGAAICNFSIRNADNGGNFLGDGVSGFFLYGAQVETGVATNYIVTTTAAVSVGPVAGVPRLNYLGSSCGRLLLEPQRKNEITNNNNFATGAANVTVLSNNATSPEGYQNADLITGDAGTLTKSVNFGGAPAGAYTLSVFAKYNTQQWIQLAAGGIATYANFDIQNGVLGTTNGTSQIEDYGNGWYRCSVNLVSGTPLSFVLFLVTNGTSARFSTTTSTGSFWAYGIQSEIGAYQTSVIPTLGAAVSRGADSASKTGISSLIGQTEGTLFVEFVVDSSSSPTMAFFVSAAGVFDNAIWIQQNASDSVIFRVFSGTTEQCSITKTGLTNGQTVKIAGAYKANDFVLYVNGVQVGTDNSGTIPSSLSQLEIGSYAEVGSPYNQNRPVSQALLFKTRLSNADLATLTTI
jgi:hypothetical protein